jgi:hypothetical protein
VPESWERRMSAFARGNGATSAVWLLLALAATASAAFGFDLLLRYEGTAGAEASAPEMWPRASEIALDPSRANLVLLVHPECPCSRPSVSELAKLMARAGSHIVAHVLFVMPPGLSADPVASGMWDTASHIPKTTPLIDPHGTEARRLGALTSGQVVRLLNRNETKHTSSFRAAIRSSHALPAA